MPTPSEPVVILLVEDDLMVQKIVRLTLERDGYLVLTAENGEEALVVSRNYSGKIDLLLTDVCMPKMSGLQLCKRIIMERPDICVVLMSGTFDEENPGYPCLRKPFGSTQLSEAVRSMLPACQKADNKRT